MEIKIINDVEKNKLVLSDVNRCISRGTDVGIIVTHSS